MGVKYENANLITIFRFRVKHDALFHLLFFLIYTHMTIYSNAFLVSKRPNTPGKYFKCYNGHDFISVAKLNQSYEQL